MPRISKKPRIEAITSPSRDPEDEDSEGEVSKPNAIEQPLPEWYQKPRKPSIMPTRALEARLQNIGEFISNLKKDHQKGVTDLTKHFDKILGELHDLEFIKVNPFFLARKRLLDNERGLPQIFRQEFSGGICYPQYIQDDAKLLYTRWFNQIFEVDLFKGILNMVKSPESKGGPKIDEKFKQEWRYFGNHDLVNGQWWGSQLAAIRDGAHGSAQGGIAGIKGKGATSIVLSGDMYKETDRDEGDEIWYSGTKKPTGSINVDYTDGTQQLLDSEKQNPKQPVRVMRSAALPASNRYKPKKGFRFDGLYEILSHRVIDIQTKHLVFHLKR
ncbi:hypothetical protein EJ08DRAFT_276628 [Tothia fuscella]|uniref:YDG domain-containing protein n=1 Tax=Tothia fuscella TaxID=1048955 RepID=A0A9P4NQA8_9PEZI|nr:hypothetical protein EJ08DRAFT_276628 [Tothia fuscella]